MTLRNFTDKVKKGVFPVITHDEFVDMAIGNEDSEYHVDDEKLVFVAQNLIDRIQESRAKTHLVTRGAARTRRDSGSAE